MKQLNTIELMVGVLCIIYYFVCVVSVGPNVSLLYIWMTAGILLMVKAGGCLLFWNRFCGGRKWVKFLYGTLDLLIALVTLSFLLFAGFVISDIHEEAEGGCDYVIILGARVRDGKPSEILQKRIQAAYEYLQKNPEAKAVGTGGVADPEEISEGKCIADTLHEMGIPADRILYEERSETTVENMKFALETIPDHPEHIAVVSNGFHIFRAKYILSGFTEAQVDGIAAPGGGVAVLHYIMREYIVFAVDLVAGNYK